MHTELFRHSKIKVLLDTGTEGPKHDPYGYEEYIVTTQAGTTCLHLGLGMWIEHNKHRIEANDLVGDTYEIRERKLVDVIFPKLTGFRMEEIYKIQKKRAERCTACGAKARHFRTERGYPGEHFTVCGKCSHVVNNYFCESEIM